MNAKQGSLAMSCARRTSARKRVQTFGTALLLPILILWTSFLAYLTDNSYPLAKPEILIALAGMSLVAVLCAMLKVTNRARWYGLVIIGMIAFFIDIHFDWMDQINKYHLIVMLLGFVGLAWALGENFYLISTAVFVTFFISTIALYYLDSRKTNIHFEFTRQKLSATTNPPPRIIHLILDEHIGIEGMPTGIRSGSVVRQQLSEFYRKHGFFVFGGAFSHYFWTQNSISNLLNFSAEDRDEVLVDHDHGSDQLLRNNYFAMLSEQHYQINIVGSTYLDFCLEKSAIVAIKNCFKYKQSALYPIAHIDLPLFHKLQVLFAGYLQKSYRYKRVKSFYENAHHVGAGLGIHLPSWTWDSEKARPYMGPLNTMDILDDLWKEIESVPRGNVVFAHLLLPHAPYAFKTDCSVRSLFEWESWWENGGNSLELRKWDDRSFNSLESREKRYQLYFQQMSCLYLKLDELFERMKAAGIFDESIIILHGDHGSRIVQHVPSLNNRGILTKQDLIEGHSTLFAVKIPGRAGGYDSSPRPIEELLANIFSIRQQVRPSLAPTLDEPFVYLLGRQPRAALLPVPYPM